ncbi:MAG: MurR/RpiR family transcriptional regulator, partial [Chloroflexi bacterium]|nr:MurR/RpiR family transcriptional regulator [Chloroflexota bacterium]
MDTENTLESRIKSTYARLGKSEQRVADFVLRHGPEVARMSVASLAAQCGVSDPTVVRFANHIGFE